uniref:RNA binding motif protein 39a n=1 Tax=Sphaeramia orbicularis TaxID=375764 RepID=A0A672ZGT6_9TELE
MCFSPFLIGCCVSNRKKRSRERKRSRSREKKRSRSRERKRSRSRERRRSRSRERRRSRSRERGGRYRDHHKSYEYTQNTIEEGDTETTTSRTNSQKQPIDNLTPEERDARTVFCMQLAARIRPRDLEEFFSAVGKVRDVRMISDRNSRRSKGIAYIEFVEASSVPLAIGLTGQRLLGVPIIVQASQAEKNRAAAAANNLQRGSSGPMRLYVGSLHFNITEEMLRGIFEPFGRIESIQLMMDTETGRSKGYGFITFSDAECAKKALDQLNEHTDASTASSFLDSDELERSGIELGTTGTPATDGSGLQIPPAAQQALQMSEPSPSEPWLLCQPLATHCFHLSNMFQPTGNNIPGWEVDIQHDVIEECNKHGRIMLSVSSASCQGNVYVKCPSIPAAMAAVNALHGRYFAGKMITAAYVPLTDLSQPVPRVLSLPHSCWLRPRAGDPTVWTLDSWPIPFYTQHFIAFSVFLQFPVVVLICIYGRGI